MSSKNFGLFNWNKNRDKELDSEPYISESDYWLREKPDELKEINELSRRLKEEDDSIIDY